MRTVLTAFIMIAITISTLYGGDFKKFESKSKGISIELPKNWNYKSIDDGKTEQMFVSLEKIKKETDMYTVGVAFTKISRFSQSFNVQNDDQIVPLWTYALKKQYESYHVFKPLTEKQCSIGDYRGVLSEYEFQPQAGIASIHVWQMTLAHSDNLVSITFECPAVSHEQYRMTFENAMQTISLN